MAKKVTKKAAVKKTAPKTVKKAPATKTVAKKVEVKKIATKKVATKEPTQAKAKTQKVAVKEVPTKVETTKVKGGKSALDKATELFAGEEYQRSLERLQKLRKEGEWKLLKLKDENINIRINKQLDKLGKKKLLELNKGEIVAAKGIRFQNKEEIKGIVKKTREKINEEFAPIFDEAKSIEKEQICSAKEAYAVAIQKAKEDYATDLEALKQKYSNPNVNVKDKKVDYNAAKISYKSKLNAARNARFSAIEAAKEERYQTYQQKHEYLNALCLNKVGEGETNKYGFETYIRNFNFATWLTKNALFLIVGIVFLVMLAMIGIGGGLNANWFLNALTSIAPKIFFALGVAGLILLAGTDLSIARLAAVGTSFSLMILTDAKNSLTWFPHLYTMPLGVRVVVALAVSIAICVVFTSISGFFTAKFKMHPFISTLAVQLIVYGFFQTFFSSVSAFTIDSDTVQTVLAGKGGWLLIVYAAIAIIVVWFIWNKTKFGKNLYAVGGNPEAAAVSGINPFKITMLAFVMAGILYGLGGFTYALQAASGNFNSCTGFDTDAIAACVIGGISFSGGVGSVLGAVGGAVILGFLTACFNALGIDTNIQFVIKGLIILIAVTLDCVKYIRKK